MRTVFRSCTCATSRRMKHLKDFEFANIPNIENSESTSSLQIFRTLRTLNLAFIFPLRYSGDIGVARTLNFADIPNILCYFCFARTLSLCRHLQSFPLFRLVMKETLA